MSAPPDPLRDAVVRRAGNRCEYCQLPAQLQVGGFEIDHVLPRSQGGQTDMAMVTNAANGAMLAQDARWHVERVSDLSSVL